MRLRTVHKADGSIWLEEIATIDRSFWTFDDLEKEPSPLQTQPFYFYIPMPVNAEGDGPATEDECVRIEHEVWSDDYATMAKCQSAEDALLVAKALNKYFGTATEGKDR